MNSSNERTLDILFRFSGNVFQERKLGACLEMLNLKKKDLIITSNSITEKLLLHQVNDRAVILNASLYGKGEPSEDSVNEILKRANAFPYERIIAIGGGAIIDIAKLCIFGDKKNVSEIFDNPGSLCKRRELIALPTTCGTGSEVTNVSVVEFLNLHSKLGLQMDLLFPDKAILVEELLLSLPYAIFVSTSIDALSHAIESLLSPKANPYTDMFARSAIEGIIKNMQEIAGENRLPKNIRLSLISANMAGIAFSIAGCATMHALSFPLGANYHLAHGEAIYAVFASTLRFYEKTNTPLEKLKDILNPLFGGTDTIGALLSLLYKAYEGKNFKDLEITETQCEEWAISVYENQQRLLRNAPIILTCEDLATIYKSCMKEG